MIIPTILCGGAGSRLWPVSRELHPKPFIRMADHTSFLQKAFIRGADLPGVQEILTVTNRELWFKTQEEFREVNHQRLKTSYILEPNGRNTAAAIALASVRAVQVHGEKVILLILPADHLIENGKAFREAVVQAEQLAKQGKLVTFGIHPERPETGYGYIEGDGNTVLRFIEKPSAPKAQEYLEAGRFFWNSGMLCFEAGAIVRQMNLYCADIITGAAECVSKSKLVTNQALGCLELDSESFNTIPENSIDYAVMEPAAAAKGELANSVAVVPCDIGWSDIGSWDSFGELMAADSHGNRIEGEVLVHQTNDCVIKGEDRLISAVGVDNLVVIDTSDALLVASKEHVQDVKHIFNRLKKDKHEAHRLHRTVYRPWGTYTVLEEGGGFKIKRIIVNPGASLSLQLHNHRSEHWVVVSGEAKVVNDDKEILVRENESTFIPKGCKHRLMNAGTLPCVIIEVQCGDYVGEDDIVRFDDVYGRSI